MKYRKKPVVIDAIKWTGENLAAICYFTGICGAELKGENDTLKIKTLEGVMTASCGDYIIKGVRGEFYSCKPDIFAQTYEEVQE